MQKNSSLKGFLAMLIATFFWGLSFIVTKATSNIPMSFLVGFRLLLGGITIALIYNKRLYKLNKKLVLCGIILGLLYGAGILIQSYGTQLTTAGRSAFLSSDTCIFMPFFEWIILKSKPKLRQILAAFVCFVGIGLVALTEELRIDFGDVLSIFSGMLFGVEIALLSKYMEENHDEMLLNAVLLVSGGIASLLITLIGGNIPKAITTDNIGGMIFLGVLCAAIPLICEAIALKNIKPTSVTILLGFIAVFGALSSVIVFKESFSVRNIIGFVLILVSAIISVLEKT